MFWAARIAAMVAAAVGFVGASFAETTLVYDVTVSKFHPFFRGVQKPFKEGVENASAGRIKIKFPAAALAKQRQQWGAVLSGIADIGIISTGHYRNRLILAGIGQLPFAAPSAEAASVALWRTQKAIFFKVSEYKDFELLALFTSAPSLIFTRDQRITELSDLEGMKIRVSAGIGPTMATTLGAVPVPSDGPQIFEYASKGIVDGLFLNFGAVRAFKITRYVPYATIVPGGLGTQSWAVVMNKEKWRDLSKADRDAIETASGEDLSRSGGRAWDRAAERGRREWEKEHGNPNIAGAGFVTQIRERTAFAKEDWLEAAANRGIDGAAAFAFYEAQLETLKE